MRKTDIHAHILPGLDDGASDEGESLKMLRMAAKQGVRAVTATPHYSEAFRSTSPEEIRRQCMLLEQKAQEEVRQNFKIYPGQEIFYAEDVVQKLKEGRLLTLGASAYVLIEFHPASPYSMIYKGIREMTMAQYWPVIAHIERCTALREKGRVEELIDAGALMQMNYRSIGGKWYEETTRWCRKMLKEGNVHCLGTDMHNTKTRRPETQKACEWMEKHLDDIYIRDIYYRNAEKILGNKVIKI